jgi:hypothetical protein
MDWLSKHKYLSTASRSLSSLTTLDGRVMEFVAEPVVTAMGIANHATVNQMEASQGFAVPVVNKFPDVFPE